MTAAAEQLLRDGDLFTAVGGRLVVHDRSSRDALRAAIRDCAASLDHAERETGRMLRVAGPESD